MFQERFSQEGGSGNDQITTLQSQVEEVKGVMTQNIERVLERGQRLEELMDKTTDLEANVSRIQTENIKLDWDWDTEVCTLLLLNHLIVIAKDAYFVPKFKKSNTLSPFSYCYHHLNHVSFSLLKPSCVLLVHR